MHEKVFWGKLWRIRLQPPRYLPLCKYEILSRKRSVLMCMKFYQKSSKLKRLLKSIWEFVIVFKVAFFITPTMISTRNLFYFFFNYRCYYHECSSMIALATSKSYQPCFLGPSGVLPARKSEHIQCTGKKQYWNSKLMDFFHLHLSGLTHFGFWGQHYWSHFFTSGSPLQGDK